MKKQLLFATFASIFAFSACKNDGGTTANATTTTASTTTTTPAAIDKTPKRAEIKEMPSEKVAALLGLDVAEKQIYNGFYEYYLGADGKEVLHGKFSAKTAYDTEAFMKKHGKGEDGSEEYLESMFAFQEGEYSGQFVEGAKDGKMNFNVSFYESGGSGYIIFDAQTKSCTEGEYNGMGEAVCFGYKGKLKDCKISEFAGLSIEKECD
jgi:hypothetical protein